MEKVRLGKGMGMLEETGGQKGGGGGGGGWVCGGERVGDYSSVGIPRWVWI